jgi:hypothetical protein
MKSRAHFRLIHMPCCGLLAGIAALLMATSAHAATPWTHTGEENCVVVRKTPDGFLAVRDKPSTKGKIVATLRPKFPLTIPSNAQFLEGEDYKLYKDWKKWTRVKGWFTTEDADPSWGWVYSKYIKKVPCDSDEMMDDGLVEGRDYETNKVDINPDKEQKTGMPDEMLADWCKRNDPNTTAQSCIELKSETHIKRPCWPKWVGLKEC